MITLGTRSGHGRRDPAEDIGRAGLLDEFEYGLRLGSGAPGLVSVFTGARGIGKTAMLARRKFSSSISIPVSLSFRIA